MEIETECTVIERSQTETLDGNCDIGVWRVCELPRSVSACLCQAVFASVSVCRWIASGVCV